MLGAGRGWKSARVPAGFLGGQREGWRGVETVQEVGGWVWAHLNLSGLSLSQHLGKLQNLLSLNCGAGAREKVCACVCVYRGRRRWAAVGGWCEGMAMGSANDGKNTISLIPLWF